MKLYDTIVIGAGAAGLFYGALSEPGTDSLIIDHSERPGLKLLISGSGQCNITHDGSIKDFITRYGQNGRYIRSALYGANNLSLVEFLNKNGIKTVTRDDGKIFPESLKAYCAASLCLLEFVRSVITYILCVFFFVYRRIIR